MASDKSAEPRQTPYRELADTPALRDPVAFELRPPGQDRVPRAARHERRWLWAVLLVLVLLALVVAFFPPQMNLQMAKTPGTATEPDAPPPTPSAAVTVDASARAQAEAMLSDLLRLSARLELTNASLWGEPEWSEAAAASAQGDRLLARNKPAEARDAYERAHRLLVRLEGGRTERLQRAMSAGQQALENDDGESAATHFARALAIEPGHQAAVEGLARATIRGEVLALVQGGREAETQGDLEAARAAYEQAVELDGEDGVARQALARVASHLVEAEFRHAMAQAWQALDADRFVAAEQALTDAMRLKPDSHAVKDLRERLALARQRAALTALRAQADEALASEDWQRALTLYEKALTIGPAAAFAKRGREVAAARARLHEQLDRYLAAPTRLYSSEPLANAERLLASVGDVSTDEPKLRAKVKGLRRHVNAARTPVSVPLHSDGKTDVVIYRVGIRGRFLEQRIELRPGTYTVVGSRVGFRDVRKVFTVHPNRPVEPIAIRCEERI